MKRVLTRIGRFIRKYKIVAIVVLLFVVFGLYYLLSQQLWKDYQTAYEMRHTQLQTETDRVLKMPATISDEKRAKLAELKELAQQSNGNCQINALIGWQIIIPSLQGQNDHCEALSVKDQTLKASLDKLVLYFESEQALVGVMTSADLASEVDETSFERQLAQWQDMLARVKDLKVQDDFEPVKQVSVMNVEKIVGAWQTLQAAHIATDQKAYEEARAKLAESYDGLAAIAPVSEKHLAPLIQAVQSAHATSF